MTILLNKVTEASAKTFFLIAASTSVLAVIMICVFLFANGLPAVNEIGVVSFLTGTSWKPEIGLYGILPMILGSIYVTLGALLLGVPVGILCAIYLARFAGARIRKLIKPGVELLAGIPSVAYGFFGLVIIVPFIRTYIGGHGQSILAASIILGIMILPTIITVAESSIEAVPKSYYDGARALGADHEGTVVRIMVPAAVSGITAGIILGVGRTIGETMAVLMVAGNQARIPDSVLDGVRTLTTSIVLEMGYATDLHREALIATACVLLVFILIINLLFSGLKRRAIKR